MRRQAQKRSNLYVYPAGISTACSGLEIKDRTTEAQKKDEKGLRGYFVSTVGFLRSAQEAFSRASTAELLGRYRVRLHNFGLTV